MMTPQRQALGAVLIGLAALTWSADARSPAAADTTLGAASPKELRCRLFARALDVAVQLDTHDGTTEVGQWVVAEATEGWTVHDVQLVTGTKPTGYPQAWAHVCLTRVVPG